MGVGMGLEMDGKQSHGQRAGISARAEAKLRPSGQITRTSVAL